jgi:hypothetical protein
MAMNNIQSHLDKLRDDAAECAVLASETGDKQARERLFTDSHRYSALADEVERALSEER